MSDLRQIALAGLCFLFTGPAVAWADDPTTDDPRPERPDFYVEDPMAPHNTSGTAARVGTAVGFVYGERQDVLAVGLSAAAGHRWGRLTLEAEYTYLRF